MSRTDHHRPWKIRAADRTVTDGMAYFWHDEYAHIRTGECGPRCEWTLPHKMLCKPPQWFVRASWWGPERQRERAGLRAMANEWNNHFYLDDEDFPNFHHRHRSVWEWC